MIRAGLPAATAVAAAAVAAAGYAVERPLAGRLRRVPRCDLGEWGLRPAFGRDPAPRHVHALAQALRVVAGAGARLVAALAGRVRLPGRLVGGRSAGDDRGGRAGPHRPAPGVGGPGRAVPHARYERLPSTGHMVMYERPQRVSTLLADLIAG